MTRGRIAQHGHAQRGKTSPTYRSWESMKSRCTRKEEKHVKTYSGRGIKVCARWADSFDNFLADMGERPDGTTLDRFPNNDGDYEPGNCRWATAKQQSDNSRHARSVTYGGRTMRMLDWAAEFGISKSGLYARIERLGESAAFEMGSNRRHHATRE